MNFSIDASKNWAPQNYSHLTLSISCQYIHTTSGTVMLHLLIVYESIIYIFSIDSMKFEKLHLRTCLPGITPSNSGSNELIKYPMGASQWNHPYHIVSISFHYICTTSGTVMIRIILVQKIMTYIYTQLNLWNFQWEHPRTWPPRTTPTSSSLCLTIIFIQPQEQGCSLQIWFRKSLNIPSNELIKFPGGASQNLTTRYYPYLLVSISCHYIHTTSGTVMLPLILIRKINIWIK